MQGMRVCCRYLFLPHVASERFLALLPRLQQVALEEKALGERYPQYDEYKKKVKKVRFNQEI